MPPETPEDARAVLRALASWLGVFGVDRCKFLYIIVNRE